MWTMEWVDIASVTDANTEFNSYLANFKEFNETHKETQQVLFPKTEQLHKITPHLISQGKQQNKKIKNHYHE